MAAEYAVAGREVLDIVEQVVEQYEPALGEVRIGILMRNVAPRSAGKRIYGKAKLVGPEQKALMAAFFPPDETPDYVIWFAQDTWDELTEKQRLALAHHELYHCQITDNGKHKMRSHDLNEFHRIIDVHGLWWPQADETEQVFRATLGLMPAKGGVMTFDPTLFPTNGAEVFEEEDQNA